VVSRAEVPRVGFEKPHGHLNRLWVASFEQFEFPSNASWKRKHLVGLMESTCSFLPIRHLLWAFRAVSERLMHSLTKLFQFSRVCFENAHGVCASIVAVVKVRREKALDFSG
jgi:hypothetical protein